jgi:hypothetical protein
MSHAKYTYEQLLEKTLRARIHLEKVKPVDHSRMCPVEDPESCAPCNCGASGKNAPIEAALQELKL